MFLLLLLQQAQARAMSADERELNRVAETCDTYHHLGLPPGMLCVLHFKLEFLVFHLFHINFHLAYINICLVLLKQ